MKEWKSTCQIIIVATGEWDWIGGVRKALFLCAVYNTIEYEILCLYYQVIKDNQYTHYDWDKPSKVPSRYMFGTGQIAVWLLSLNQALFCFYDKQRGNHFQDTKKPGDQSRSNLPAPLFLASQCQINSIIFSSILGKFLPFPSKWIWTFQ